MNKERYKHIGFFVPEDDDSFFSTPIYVFRNKLFIHNLDSNDTITTFLRTQTNLRFLSHDGDMYRIGDTGIFAFKYGEDIIHGSRETISDSLSVFAPKLIQLPHLQLEIASFLGSKSLALLALKNASAKGGDLKNDSDFCELISKEFCISRAEMATIGF